jgi:hypothetical protein
MREVASYDGRSRYSRSWFLTRRRSVTIRGRQAVVAGDPAHGTGVVLGRRRGRRLRALSIATLADPKRVSTSYLAKPLQAR